MNTKRLRLPLILVCLSGAAVAQLQPDQKVTDFQTLVALFNKQYAPYDWKRDVMNFDMLQLGPWLARINATKDDVSFYEVCAAYIASLNDAHSEFFMDTDFTADLGFQVDLYDGKALVDFISADIGLTVDFQVGDELISVDGVSVASWLEEFGKYSSYANPRSTDRYNAQSITFRRQQTYPRAAQIGETAEVVVLPQGVANPRTYTMSWNKTGLPISEVGPVPSPHVSGRVRRPEKPSGSQSASLLSLENNRIPIQKEVRGFGLLPPVFLAAFPSSFVRRLGQGSDLFFSGTFSSGGKKIGFLRIPDFLDPGRSALAGFAFSQFEQEVTYMQNNTDAMVIDLMRNPGGLGCYAESLLQDLIPYRFRGIGQQIRVTQDWLVGISQEINRSASIGFDQTTVEQLKALLTDLQAASTANRGLTETVPLCMTYFERDSATDSRGNSIAYTKPLLLLTDEFTTSAAEIFAAEFQDSQRGPLFGWRTAGAGGTVNGPYYSGYYSEGLADVTQSILIRNNYRRTPDFPVTDMIENVGVRPDIAADYMTEDNLTNHGKAFVDGFTAAVLALVE